MASEAGDKCHARAKCAILAALLCLVGCVSSPPGSDGYWDYAHSTNGPQDRMSDYGICEVGWMRSPLAAEIARQQARPLGTDRTWAEVYRDQRMRKEWDEAPRRYIRRCMEALGYKLRWFSDACPRGCVTSR